MHSKCYFSMERRCSWKRKILGQQRVHLLQKLTSFRVCNVILTIFYQSFIESLLTFYLLVQMAFCERQYSEGLLQIQQGDLCSLWEKHVAQKAKLLFILLIYYLFLISHFTKQNYISENTTTPQIMEREGQHLLYY